MSVEPAVFFRSIEQLLNEGTVAGMDERALLERFANHRDGRALAVLIATHGPMVLGVCRRILRQQHDVEDAFQATFLVLVRRAGSIRDPRRLAAWLHGVARSVALRTRQQARRRQGDDTEKSLSLEDPAPGPELKAEQAELLSLIDAELARLPRRYRDVLVLCDLEGRTYTEAAHHLGCPLGTVQSRLARGRQRLRGRLEGKGLEPTTLASLLTHLPPSGVPRPLVDATLRTCEAAWQAGVAPAVGFGLAEWSRSLTGTVCRRIAAAVIVTVALSASLAAFGFGNRPAPAPEPPPATVPQAQEPEKPEHNRTVLLEVRDAAENKPLPNASVWVRAWGGRSHVPVIGRTNASGQFAVDLAEETSGNVELVAAADGYVPKQIRWFGENLPETYVLGLERGLRMGGKVVDEQGRPVAGARVLPLIEVRDGEEVAAAVTDAQGLWHSNALPTSALEGKEARPIDLQVSHPDHVTTIEEDVPPAAAHAGTVVVTLKQGVSIAGSVLGPDGQPIAGASVVIEQTLQQRFLNRTVTDASGQFHFGHWIDPDDRSIALSAKTPGLAAVVRKVLVTPTIPRQTIQLTRSVPLKGRVVDTRGKPVAGASIESSEGMSEGCLEWSTTTDAQGGFEWADAPTSGSIAINVYKPTFEQALARHFYASNRAITVTMHRPLHLHGTVTDAVTGQPIEHFDLIPGWGPRTPGSQVEWLRGPSVHHLGHGRIDSRGDLFPDQGMNRSIRIEAEGYFPTELLGFRDDAEEIAHDFKLRMAKPITGVVRGRDGKPVAGAEVMLSASDNYVRIENGRLITNLTVGTPPYMTTGPDGRYTFRPQEKHVAIVVVHESGFGVRSHNQIASNWDVTLLPWGRIEGVLKIGKNIAPNQGVSAALNKLSFDGRVDYAAKADDRGRFVLDRVTPGEMTIYRYMATADHRGWIPSNPSFVDVAPGQTVRLEIGGNGRPIIGKLTLPHGFRLTDLVPGFCKLTTIRHEPRKPDDYPDFSREQQNAWYENFYKTLEGKNYYQEEREYGVSFNPDGAFRIEDVPAGQYILSLPFQGRTNNDVSGLLATAQLDVIVPAIPGGRRDEPLDLGTIRLEVYRLLHPKVGEMVRVPLRNDADGRPLDLAALRGKFVLLNLWATYREESVADISALKETYDTFGRDPRFAMISLSQDVEPDAARRYVAYRRLRWEQRYLGTKGELPHPIAAALGVEYLPQVLLIGPDSRLLARDLKGPEIKQAVARALGQEK